ncbi:2-phospho-L-lactate guanylyltransferase [Saccharopolyspora sp. TS4A08]|uniref:Phosphoenolpyruvate guanylyltransferase n=1 Tax=Saccharopolyspora ipomoeae TaxID=3042027 RepID=A0ABT6PL64_9PSEU|nr:2-phospho-L-lactate guanylyltransferase [Saccharopolyspora sp. TS4A08]MDI2028590.1 2-phospho-L-lactate guanylyltransferase [Saccharopolyspora sp. TS4A08]
MTAADTPDSTGVHLLVPLKPLNRAKSRLLAGRGPAGHAELVTAMALDTVAAARRARGVAGVVVVSSDRALTESFTALGVEVLPDEPADGLNAALRHGDEVLRARGAFRVGALQADLPALRSGELGWALRAAGTDRSFCPDLPGDGTTLLLAEPGLPLDPRFGPGSAEAHSESGAKTLLGPWESLRRDVDTEADLTSAKTTGLGPRTRARVASAE